MANFRPALRVLFIAVIVVFACSLPAAAQPKNIEVLRQQLDSGMKEHHIAGMMLALVKKDTVLYTGGIGYADIEKQVPVCDTQLFRLASITKMFTALGIVNLIKRGKLKATTKLKDIAPEIPFSNDWEATNPVTIADLLEHSTGFSDKGPFEEFINDNKDYSGIKGVLVFKKFMHSRWQPGKAHSYSGVNYAILDYVIEKISGQPVNDYLRQNIFIPLHMPYANVHLASDGTTAYTKAYIWRNNEMQPVPHMPCYKAGYASLNASAIDCANALKAYLSDWQTPGGQFLTKEIMYDAETPHTYLSARAGMKNTYAYGNECYEHGGQLFRGHMGAMGGYLSAFLYDRYLGTGYAVSINTFNEDFFQWANELIRSFLLQQNKNSAAPEQYAINKKSVAPFEGYYRLSNPGQLYTGFFERLQNTLQVKQNSNDLDVHILMRGTMKWKPADSTGKCFTDGSVYPQNMLLRDDNNKPVIVHNTLYFEKVSALEAKAPVILFISSVLLLLSSLLVCIVVRLVFFFRKIKTPAFVLLLSPVMAAIGIMLVALAGIHVLEDMGASTQMGSDQQLWVAGKYLLGFFSIFTTCLLLYQWKHLKWILARIYFSLTALAGLYLLWILTMNHWFG